MHKPAIGLILAVTLSVFGDANAQALTFSACPHNLGFTCTTLTVPLQRAGPATSAIALSIERQQSGATPTRDAVLALAGGPGQAATPLAGFIAKAIAPALRSRDLIVFDQRGTGESAPLRCKALQDASALESSNPQATSTLAERCARELGPARAAFTSSESVEDIEAIRRALGYEKLVLYGTSYGTKVAELYAERYPQNVEALVLDSVVLPEGPEAFALSTLKALTPVMMELCSRNACRGVTSSPMSDIAQLAAQLRHRRLSGWVYDGSGQRHSLSIGEPDLLRILLAGDLNPALRALFPAAVRSALRRDPDPLLRLDALSQGLIPNLPKPPVSPGPEGRAAQESDALFLATSCEELTFPWQLASPQNIRRSEALAALRRLPGSELYPFDANTAWEDSVIPLCIGWPTATPAAKPQNTLPDVPTLILSGAQDLRTPTTNARALAQRIPDAQVEVVPYTGHSVLGSDFGGCASEAVEAFFAGVASEPCKATSNVFSPTPVTPSRLTFIKPLPGLQGKTGRTVNAILDTMTDLSRQVIGATLQLEQELPSGSSFGGLHGGYARITSTALRLNHFSFVDGVELTGIFTLHAGEIQPATVRISGSAAAHGVVRLGFAKSVSGTLDGHRFHVSLATVKLARQTPRGWPSHPLRLRLTGLARIR